VLLLPIYHAKKRGGGGCPFFKVNELVSFN
jgi:hypothetical protein